MTGKICKGCFIRIGFFKRKFLCQICSGHFCVSCFGTVKQNAEQLRDKLCALTGFNCLQCIVLEFRNIKREHLCLLQNKQLTEYLSGKNISTVACKEKYDLIDLIVNYAKTNNMLSEEDRAEEYIHENHLRNLQQAAHTRRQQEQDPNNQTFSSTYENSQQQQYEQQNQRSSQGASQNFSSTYQQTNISSNHYREQSQSNRSSQQDSHEPNTSQNQFTSENQQPSSNLSPPNCQAGRKWKSMEDVSTLDEIPSLSVLELKQVLTANFIDYKGCVEKKELVDKVVMLYESIQRHKREEEAKENQGTSSEEDKINDYDRDICKICMDRTIDCVLLNCGHLVVCTKCGKRLSECPICRALVAKVVRTFRV